MKWSISHQIPRALSREEILKEDKGCRSCRYGWSGIPGGPEACSPRMGGSIRYLVVNGAECEPYLTSDFRVMCDYTQELIGGIKIALKLMPNAKAVIGVEDNKPEAIKKL